MRKIKSSTEFITDAKLTHGDKYDYSLVNYKTAKFSVQIICKKHGEFTQIAGDHINGSNCPKCSFKIINTDEFIIKANLKHKNIYDYSLVKYFNSRDKIIIICPIHGEFEQAPRHHLDGRGCVKCGNKKCGDMNKISQDEFIKKAILIHGNKFNYLLVNYVLYSKNIKIICKKHGMFEQTPANHLKGHNCPMCNSSIGENKIVQFLSSKNIKFIQQQKFHDCKDIRQLPFDFYLPDYNICIEFHGIQHYKPIKYFGGINSFNKQQKRDNIKTLYCYDNNIQFIVIKYTENIDNELSLIFI